MITVMGASGNVGGATARLLLEAGEQVRALGRSRERLAALEQRGATVLTGEASDPAHLTEAFRGADAVLTLLPHDPSAVDYHAEQTRIGESIVRSVRDAGVRRVVAVSSIGADLPRGTGFVTSLYAQEQRLRALAEVDVVVLRPGNFFENFAAALDVVREHGVHADAVAPDVPIPMIAARDVAAAAAGELRRGAGPAGFAVRELLGERDLTFTEATAVLGAAIGRPDLPYVRLPDSEMIDALRAAGFSPTAAALHVELGRALGDGTIVSREGRTPQNTTPTRFEDVVPELTRSYQEV